MNKIFRLFRKKKKKKDERSNKVELVKQFETSETETLVNRVDHGSETYKNFDHQRFSSYPTPSRKRNLNQLPKIITDPTQLAIISDYNRRNTYNAFNHNNHNNRHSSYNHSNSYSSYNHNYRHSSFHQDGFDIEKLIDIRKSIINQKVKPMQISSGICPNCNNPIAEFGYYTKWCLQCQSNLFKDKFGSWSSDYDVIDTFIQETQLTSQSRFDFLEWIPYKKFKNIKQLRSSDYSCDYRALWLDGPYEKWDVDTAQYVRCGKRRVTLKSFECYINIVKQCLNLDPLMRPTADQLYKTLGKWLCLLLNVTTSDIAKEFHEANERLTLFDNKFEVHPEATYNSRFYNFKGFDSSQKTLSLNSHKL
ncbi:21253_t:CDS:2 [Dentiscutata erythropus]|uniref:21253_t:CDS:1 n=1 Tax=Dentiscutata erythropus TaxID=1348616 RepID=A0A9N8VMG4_9GLOM|nr:21253_t:CDS:2 [Dentiscutata erythropus]